MHEAVPAAPVKRSDQPQKAYRAFVRSGALDGLGLGLGLGVRGAAIRCRQGGRQAAPVRAERSMTS
ncbi:hypothetical protein M2352_004263 [Azospirillum fermentarium]|nr:hypothetical protein [Azospirillum fermentarium]